MSLFHLNVSPWALRRSSFTSMCGPCPPIPRHVGFHPTLSRASSIPPPMAANPHPTVQQDLADVRCGASHSDSFAPPIFFTTGLRHTNATCHAMSHEHGPLVIQQFPFDVSQLCYTDLTLGDSAMYYGNSVASWASIYHILHVVRWLSNRSITAPSSTDYLFAKASPPLPNTLLHPPNNPANAGKNGVLKFQHCTQKRQRGTYPHCECPRTCSSGCKWKGSKSASDTSPFLIFTRRTSCRHSSLTPRTNYAGACVL